MFQLLQPGESSKRKHLLGHCYPFEDVAQLTRAGFRRPATPKLGQMTAYLLEGSTIAAVVTARLAKGNGAIVKNLPDDGGDFANAIILFVIADVEDFVVHGLARRL